MLNDQALSHFFSFRFSEGFSEVKRITGNVFNTPNHQREREKKFQNRVGKCVVYFKRQYLRS